MGLSQVIFVWPGQEEKYPASQHRLCLSFQNRLSWCKDDRIQCSHDSVEDYQKYNWKVHLFKYLNACIRSPIRLSSSLIWTIFLETIVQKYHVVAVYIESQTKYIWFSCEACKNSLLNSHCFYFQKNIPMLTHACLYFHKTYARSQGTLHAFNWAKHD